MAIAKVEARSSGVEYLLDMQGVGGSKPPVPIFPQESVLLGLKFPSLVQDVESLRTELFEFFKI